MENFINYIKDPIIAVPVAVISATFFLVLTFNIFFTKEKSYEEAVREQRQRNQEIFGIAKGERSKKDKKFKKWNRKIKDKSGDEIAGSADDAMHSKEENEVTPPGNNSQKRKKKRRKSKVVVENKEDQTPALASSSGETSDEHAHSRNNSLSKENTPSTENIHFSEKEGVETSDEDKEVRNLEEEVEKVDLEIIEEVLQPPLKDASPSGRKKSKKQKSSQKHSSTSFDKLSLEQYIHNTSFSEEELQMLIDTLSKKLQSSGSEWTKINDPITILKKQLQEKEILIEAEQAKSFAANSKLKELRSEFTHDKNKMTSTERSLKDKIICQQQELLNYHNNLQRTHDQHLSEVASLQTKMQQLQAKLTEEHNMAIQHLKEENNQLQQVLKCTETDAKKRSNLEISRLQHELEQYESRQAGLQQVNEDLREHVQKLVTSHSEEEFNWKKRISDITAKLQQTETSWSSLTQDMQKTRSTFEAEATNLRKRLQDLEYVISSKDQELQKFQSRYDDVHKQRVDLSNRLDQVRGDLHQLSNKVREQEAEIERHKLENQHLLASLKEEREDQRKSLDLAEYEKKMDQMKKINNQAQEEVNNYKNEIVNLTEELTNLSLMNKNQEVELEQARVLVSSMEKNKEEQVALLLKEYESKLAQVQEETRNKVSWEWEQRVASMEEQLKVEKTQQTVLVNQNKQLETFQTKLQSILRSASPTENLNNSNELLDFIEVRLKNSEMNKASNEQVSVLTTKLNQFKLVLADTEQTLSVLQDKVEHEVQSWNRKIETAEKNLSKALKDKETLLTENTNLSKTLGEVLQQMQLVEKDKTKFEQGIVTLEKNASELKKQLSQLQERLVTEEKEKSALLKQIGDLKQNYQSMREQLKTSTLETECLRSQMSKMTLKSTEIAEKKIEKVDSDVKLPDNKLNQPSAWGKKLVPENNVQQMEKVVDNKPQQVEKAVDNKPQQVEKAVDNKPQPIQKVVDNKPQQVEKVDNKPQQIEKVVDNKPQQIEKIVDIKPQQIEKVVDIKPQQIEKVVDNKPQQVEKVVENKPQQIEKEDNVVKQSENKNQQGEKTKVDPKQFKNKQQKTEQSEPEVKPTENIVKEAEIVQQIEKVELDQKQREAKPEQSQIVEVSLKQLDKAEKPAEGEQKQQDNQQSENAESENKGADDMQKEASPDFGTENQAGKKKSKKNKKKNTKK